MDLTPADYVEKTDGFCDVSISVMDMPPEKPQIWVLGQPLLRRYLSVYDMKERRVGFSLASSEGAQAGDSQDANSFLQSARNSGLKVVKERKMRLRRSGEAEAPGTVAI